MIKAFPIHYMHQLCLGVMKKLLMAWKRGSKEVHLCARRLDEISVKLLSLRLSIPSCFARKPCGLVEIERWKATEFRQFLLYTGKVVLKGVLLDPYYQHFLVLNVVTSVLVSPHLTKLHLNYAKDLMKYFVELGNQLYGPEFLVYNVHSLIHMADDAETHGSLDQCSGFPFENYLQKLKSFVRSGKNPIAQVVKRLSEENDSRESHPHKMPSSILLKHPDNGHVSGNSGYVVVDKQHQSDEHGGMFLCRVYSKSESMFTYCWDSQNFCKRCFNESCHVVLKNQVIVVSIDNHLLFMEILHHLN